MKPILRKTAYILLKIIIWFVALTVLLTLIYRWVNPPFTPLMISRALFEGYDIRKDWISIEEMPQSLLNCAVASEDNFFVALWHRLRCNRKGY